MAVSIRVCFILCLTTLITVAGLDQSIPPENRAVLVQGKENWEPTGGQCSEALARISLYLGDSLEGIDGGKVEKILQNFSNYRVQFEGQILEGKKVIFCNFFPCAREGKEDYFRSWKKQMIVVCDGGHSFWQIFYDPETKKCFGLLINGYA